MAEVAMKWFSEYPHGSGRYWSVPLNGDALSFAYRKDLFENPQEKENFKKGYGYDLNVPETWEQLRDIAEFFTRPKDDLYGSVIWTSEDYDGTTMGVETLIWAWGGDLGNYKTHQVKGYLDSEASIDALKFYKELYKFHPPQFPDVYFQSLDALIKGKAAMVMTYFAVNSTLADPSLNPYAEVTGYFSSPRGPKARFTALAGQGLSVISYTKKKDLVFKFLEWFTRKDVQEKWAQLGGLSCNKDVMGSEVFLNAGPYNKEFTKSMTFVRDFWSVPEYVQLMTLSQKYWNQYILTDTISAKETMKQITQKWERIFEEAGYYKE
jgi:multiple sugar transport system substrate-binding protein